MVVGGYSSGVLVDSDIRWRWDLLGRGEGICVCSGLFWEVQEAKRGCIKQLPSVSFLKGRFQIEESGVDWAV